MSEPSADFIVIMSPEQIEVILAQHFNDVMFKVPVKVVSSNPTEAGYMFSLDFVATQPLPQQELTTQEVKESLNLDTGITTNGTQRNHKGKFVKSVVDSKS